MFGHVHTRVGAAVPLLPRRSAIASAITAAMLSLIAISLLIVACGAVKPPLVPRRLYKDWVALNARSTTRHIMRPRTPAGRQECIALKTELAAAQAAGAFVVDAFAAAATDQSADADSAPSGGLLGTFAPGHVHAAGARPRVLLLAAWPRDRPA